MDRESKNDLINVKSKRINVISKNDLINVKSKSTLKILFKSGDNDNIWKKKEPKRLSNHENSIKNVITQLSSRILLE